MTATGHDSPDLDADHAVPAGFDLSDLRDLVSSTLGRTERLLILLGYHQRMSVAEIALTLDLSQATVRGMHRRLLERLKAQWEQRQRVGMEGTGNPRRM